MPDDISLLASLLRSQVPTALQNEAMQRLTRIDHPEVPAALLDQWSGFAPDRRAQAIDLLVRRPEWVHGLLDRVAAGDLDVASLGASARQRLLGHPREAIRARAAALLVASIDPRRNRVVEQALFEFDSTKGDPVLGADLFVTHCAVCHRLGDVGGGAGPDLATLVDRSPRALVTAILDPNRAVEDKYTSYDAVTRDGDEYSGLITGQTGNSITLVSVSGIEQMILRSDLESLKASGRSLMPDGFEQLLTTRNFGDLIAFVQQHGTPFKAFDGNQPERVVAGPGDTVELNAKNAEIYGPSVVLESRYGNLGMWGSTDDRAVWTVEIEAPAKFEMRLDWACLDANAGNRFEFRIGENVLIAPVPGTGSWDDYRQAAFGVIRLEPGVHRAVFRSHGTLNGFLIDFLKVRLVPSSG